MMANLRRSAWAALILLTAGCPARVPVKKPASEPMDQPATTMPAATTLPAGMPAMMPTTAPTGGPVATSDLGQSKKTPGLFPKKPFVKLPEHFSDAGNPSTLLLEHASFNSPIPLEEFSKQPVRDLSDFHLRDGMTVDEVKKEFGDPAQLADVEDPWLVYRLTNTRELWLHFAPASHGRLVAGDVVRGAESGYVRTHVFTAN